MPEHCLQTHRVDKGNTHSAFRPVVCACHMCPMQRTGEARGAARNFLKVHILGQRLAPGVHLQDLHAALHIWPVHSDLRVCRQGHPPGGLMVHALVRLRVCIRGHQSSEIYQSCRPTP